jgi:hypothetical protein
MIFISNIYQIFAGFYILPSLKTVAVLLNQPASRFKIDFSRKPLTSTLCAPADAAPLPNTSGKVSKPKLPGLLRTDHNGFSSESPAQTRYILH